MNQNQNVAQQTLSFPEVFIYRSQRAIYVPQDESNDGVFTHSIRISVDDIACIQSRQDGYTYIRTINGNSIRIICKLNDILEKLDEYEFVQTSYNTILNLTQVDIVYARALSIKGIVYEVTQQFLSGVMETFNARRIDKNTGLKSPYPYNEDYYVHADKCARRVRPSEIIRIEVGGNFTTIHSKSERKSLTVGIPLKVWEKVLPPNHFAKINKSAIINLHYVDELITQEPYSVRLGNKTFVVSRSYFHNLKSALNIIYPSIVTDAYRAKQQY